jgi:hypothetical protein
MLELDRARSGKGAGDLAQRRSRQRHYARLLDSAAYFEIDARLQVRGAQLDAIVPGDDSDAGKNRKRSRSSLCESCHPADRFRELLFFYIDNHECLLLGVWILGKEQYP